MGRPRKKRTAEQAVRQAHQRLDPDVIHRGVLALIDSLGERHPQPIASLAAPAPPAPKPVSGAARLACVRKASLQGLRRAVARADSLEIVVHATVTSLVHHRHAPARLLQLLRHPHPCVRETILTGLGGIRDPRALSHLFPLVRNDPEPALRLEALKLIATFPRSPRATEFLLAYARLRASGPALAAPWVEAALTGLAGSRDLRVLPRLLRWSRHPDSAMRALACGSLAIHRDLRALPALYASLRDPSPRVRAAARDALCELALHHPDLPRQFPAPVRTQLLRHAARPHPFRNVQFLGALQDPRALPILLDELEEAIPPWKVIQAILALNAPGTLGQLLHRLRRPGFPERAWSAATSLLGELRDPRALPMLIQRWTRLRGRLRLREVNDVVGTLSRVPPDLEAQPQALLRPFLRHLRVRARSGAATPWTAKSLSAAVILHAWGRSQGTAALRSRLATGVGEERQALLGLYIATRDDSDLHLLSEDGDHMSPWLEPHDWPSAARTAWKRAEDSPLSLPEIRARFQAMAQDLGLALDFGGA